jgi:uncharacterized membrane protein
VEKNSSNNSYDGSYNDMKCKTYFRRAVSVVISKKIRGKCIVKPPIIEPIVTKKISLLNENPTLRKRDFLF